MGCGLRIQYHPICSDSKFPEYAEKSVLLLIRMHAPALRYTAFDALFCYTMHFITSMTPAIAYIAPALFLHCSCIASALLLHCSCIALALLLHCSCISPSLQMRCKCIAPPMLQSPALFLQCSCKAIAMFMQCSCVALAI